MTETVFGFGRQTIELGMNEKRTGLIRYGNYKPCGKKKAEEAFPKLEQDIRSLVEPESQADPQLQNTFAYTRITAKAVRQKPANPGQHMPQPFICSCDHMHI